MRTLYRSMTVLSTMALASAGVALGAGSASAALTTYCEGDASDATVPGNLVVAEGDSCVLDSVTINGSVEVQAGADLLITDSSVAEGVEVAADGYFDSTGSEVAGDVASDAGYGVYLDETAVDGAYTGDAGEGADPFLYSYDSSIAGEVTVGQGLVHLQTVNVGGPVSTEGALYTDIVDSTLADDLTVSGNAEGATFCGSEVDGASTFTGNTGVQIGTGGAIIDCEDGNYFGSDLTVSDNTDGVDVSSAIIRGALSGEGNDPAPTGSDLRVRGEVSGQFVDLSPASQKMSLKAQSAVESHSSTLDTKRDERRAVAEEQAELSGPANLG